jgi:hypothetical protein
MNWKDCLLDKSQSKEVKNIERKMIRKNEMRWQLTAQMLVLWNLKHKLLEKERVFVCFNGTGV